MSAQVFLTEWTPAGEGNWNDDSNWVDILGDNFVPDAALTEGAVIDSGGTAVVDATVPAIVELQINDGVVDIRQGGRLEVVDGGPTSIDNDGTLVLSGNAQFDVASITSEGTIALTSSSTQFMSSGDFAHSGNLELTIDSNSPVLNIDGAATLSGNIRPDFGGNTIGFGDTWSFLAADSVTSTANVVVPDGALGFGLDLQLRTDGGNASLEVVSLPVLSIDRTTGNASFRSVSGVGLDVVGYSVFSDGDLLDVDGWDSLSSQGLSGWGEANPRSSAIAELNLTESATLMPDGARLSLGSLYQQEAGVTPDGEDLRVEVTLADGTTTAGIVEFTGPINDLVLAVNPVSGDAAIQLLSTHIGPLDISGYSVFSESGSISVENWNGLSAQGVDGWEEANPRAEAIAEINLDDSTVFSTGTSFDLGAIFNGEEDLTFEYLTTDGTTLAGTVLYTEENLGPTCAPVNDLLGDLDGDGAVAFADFLVLSTNFGQNVSTYGEGDVDCDSSVAFADFLVLSTNFGQTLGAVSSVPEPTAGAAAIHFALLSLLARKRR